MPLDAMVQVLQTIPEYKTLFAKAYPDDPISEKTVARAIATFERTVVSGQAPFDKWISGDENAVGEDTKRGFDLFNGKAGCAQCHSEWNFTDNGFHDVYSSSLRSKHFLSSVVVCSRKARKSICREVSPGSFDSAP